MQQERSVGLTKKWFVAYKFDERLRVDRRIFTERQKLHDESGSRKDFRSEVIPVNNRCLGRQMCFASTLGDNPPPTKPLSTMLEPGRN
jgi:hypothetical protein